MSNRRNEYLGRMQERINRRCDKIIRLGGQQRISTVTRFVIKRARQGVCKGMSVWSTLDSSLIELSLWLRVIVP